MIEAIAIIGDEDSVRSQIAEWEAAGITMVDDYGHHPVEIAAVLKAARQATKGRVIAVVQPHRYSRLGALMEKIDCRGGQSQISRILGHARNETQKQKVQALVFVGDAIEESIDRLCAIAGELGLLGVPVFVFQEGRDPDAERAFREIARLSRGAYCQFDISAAHELAELLRAVAAYAAGGLKALADFEARNSGGAVKLLAQLH